MPAYAIVPLRPLDPHYSWFNRYLTSGDEPTAPLMGYELKPTLSRKDRVSYILHLKACEGHDQPIRQTLSSSQSSACLGKVKHALGTDRTSIGCRSWSQLRRICTYTGGGDNTVCRRPSRAG
ncbi:hypothetical protein VTK56DRAFT_9778 [Thermocarpiscus australiensis]